MEDRLREALALHRQGRLREAVVRYRAILEKHPDEARVLGLLGLAEFQVGDLDAARALLTRSLQLEPRDANAWSNLGMVHLKAEATEQSLACFERALEIQPSHPDALNNLAQALRRLGRFDQAKPLLEQLVALRPDAAAPRYALADVQLKTNHVDAAIQNFQHALKLNPEDRRIRLGLGDTYETAGKFKQARMQYLSVLNREPDSPLALARLLQLREGEPDRQWVTRAESLADAAETPEDGRIRLNVALGYYHDRQGHYDEAFRRLALGYDAQAQREPFDSDGYTRAIDRLIGTLTRRFFEQAPTSGLDTSRPIFIVGMPRSGTTLTEQILASHSQVAAGGELSMLLKVSFQIQQASASGKPYPEGLLSMTESGLRQLARRYLDHLDRVSGTALHVTDKLPFNFMHLGAIALMFPNARIIHCRRHPLDNCLSCYFTSFADQIRFANQLDTLGRYYLDYERLMRHWHDVLPVEIFDLRYEDLIGATEDRVRALLAYCDLPWEDACLRFYETERGVRTPSRWQVRQPIYQGSVARWRHYESQLGPLKRLLEPALSRY